jgi:hypothetical protein
MRVTGVVCLILALVACVCGVSATVHSQEILPPTLSSGAAVPAGCDGTTPNTNPVYEGSDMELIAKVDHGKLFHQVCSE